MPAYLVTSSERKRLTVVANAVLQQPVSNNVQWRQCPTHDRPIIECGCWQKSARNYAKKRAAANSNHP